MIEPTNSIEDGTNATKDLITVALMTLQFVLSKLPQTIQIRHLRLDRVVRAIKPEPATRFAVNAEWPANGIAKPARFNHVVLGKYFDTFF